MAISCVLIAALASAQTAGSDTVSLRIVAVQASQENRTSPQIDTQLASMKDMFAPSGYHQYDTFKLITSQKERSRYGQECRVSINARYTLVLMPLERVDSGRIRLKARIEERQDEPSAEGGARTVSVRKAMEATTVVSPGKHLNICGLRLDGGDLIVVVSAEDKQNAEKEGGDGRRGGGSSILKHIPLKAFSRD